MAGLRGPDATVVTIGALKGSATKGSDYGATTLASITIPANTSTGTGTLTITPTDDSVVEGDESDCHTWDDHRLGPFRDELRSVTLTDDDKSYANRP